jgi:hypothetical protein
LATTVWDGEPANSAPLAALGATIASDVVEAVAGADAVITMLPDPDAVASLSNSPLLIDSRPHCGPESITAIGLGQAAVQPASEPVDAMDPADRLEEHHRAGALDD